MLLCVGPPGESLSLELDAPHIITVLATIMIVVSCVLVHYEGLVILGRWVTHEPFSPRIRIATVIIGQLFLHVIEIWIFGLGYYLMANSGDLGSLVQGTEPLHFADYFYYSAAVFSTLGFGDIVPVGPMRFLTGMEAVVGLTLITWSASFVFLKMQRYWGRD